MLKMAQCILEFQNVGQEQFCILYNFSIILYLVGNLFAKARNADGMGAFLRFVAYNCLHGLLYVGVCGVMMRCDWPLFDLREICCWI